jgi:hypothetical protein
LAGFFRDRLLRETTAQAIAVLDAQFPWLCRAELRVPFARQEFGDPGKSSINQTKSNSVSER